MQHFFRTFDLLGRLALMIRSFCLLFVVGTLITASTVIAGPVTYVDAVINGNTTLADGSPLVSGTHFSATSTARDNQWNLRTFANGGTIIGSNEATGTAAEDAPMLRTVIDGLVPGASYEVYSYFWGSFNAAWRGRALLGDTSLPAPSPELPGYNSVHFETSAFLPMDGSLDIEGVNGFGQAPINGGIARTPGSTGSIATNNANIMSVAGDYFTTEVLIAEGNRSLSQISFGTTQADANGEIWIYIDDLANTANSNRTWYDGVGHRLVIPEPNTIMISLVFSAAGLLAIKGKRFG
jgi:hypothetical protein